jgi:hypothetical protein
VDTQHAIGREILVAVESLATRRGSCPVLAATG